MTTIEQHQKPAVALIGLGPMGQALARAFLRSEHPTTVWNRTAEKATDVLSAGAELASSVGGVVSSARLVLVCVRDYAAVRDVLAEHGDWRDQTVVNLTSGDPSDARSLAAWTSERGARYLDGAILTPTPAIGTPAGAALYSGDAGVYEEHRETLAALGATLTYLGDDPGAASAYDVALLDLFSTVVGGIVHAFALAGAEGIAPTTLAPYAVGIGDMLPEMIRRFAAQIEAGGFPGDRSTIASAGAGIRHVIAATQANNLDADALIATMSLIDRAIEKGHGDDGLARLAEVLSTAADD